MEKSEWQYINIWSKKIRAINLLGGKCEICDNNNIFHLCFHHICGEEKENCINNLRCHRWSTIVKEVKKCHLLCNNCHKNLHHQEDVKNDKTYRINKLIYLEYKGVKCERCCYNENPASLHFHHKKSENKSFDISEISKRFKSINDLDEYIKNELDKCEILCGNCHIVEHIDIVKFEKLKEQIYLNVFNFKEIQPKIDRNKVKELYENGMKQKDIANFLNAGKGTISDIIKELGIKKG